MPNHIFEQAVIAHLRTATAGPMDETTFEAAFGQGRGKDAQADYLRNLAQFDERHTAEFEPLLGSMRTPCGSSGVRRILAPPRVCQTTPRPASPFGARADPRGRALRDGRFAGTGSAVRERVLRRVACRSPPVISRALRLPTRAPWA